jgi:hypothetical protein
MGRTARLYYPPPRGKYNYSNGPRYASSIGKKAHDGIDGFPFFLNRKKKRNNEADMLT